MIDFKHYSFLNNRLWLIRNVIHLIPNMLSKFLNFTNGKISLLHENDGLSNRNELCILYDRII